MGVRTAFALLLVAAAATAQKVYSDHDPGVVAPRVIEKSAAEYTDEARTARLEGLAGVSLVVEPDGSVRDVYVSKPLGLGLDEKAVEAVRLWKFAPGVKDGEPVPVLTRAEVPFRLLTQRSDWHLTRADFETPKGVSRPIVAQAQFPDPVVEGAANGVVSFDVDEGGSPVNIRVELASEEKWDLATAVAGWKFRPGMLDGRPVRVHARFGFAGGQPPSVEPPPLQSASKVGRPSWRRAGLQAGLR